MILSIVIAVLVLGVAYFHWVQGLLSGIISMVLAILAGSLAVGYHEAIVAGMLGGKMGDMANGIMLCVIFAIVYGVGRIVFDSLIPGNVRLPLYLDAVGGGVCGVVVGIFAAGTLAIAMQSMPFGPSILGHSRYAVSDDKIVQVAGARRQEEALVSGALEEDLPDESKDVGLMLPADSIVVNYTAFQSESGALAGGTKLRDRHPNLLRDLFFQRVGIEPGAKHVALNVGGRKDVDVTGVFAPNSPMMQMDGENPALQRGRTLPKVVKPDPVTMTLIVRTTVAKNATDTDSKFRFSPGAVRLVVSGKSFTPAGVLYEPGRVNLLMSYRVDDYLIADATSGATIDLVFIVDRESVLADPAAKEDLKIKSGAFLEVKRLARVDLTDRAAVATMPPAAPGGGMIFKKDAITAIAPRMAEAGIADPAKK